mgnify:FL=1
MQVVDHSLELECTAAEPSVFFSRHCPIIYCYSYVLQSAHCTGETHTVCVSALGKNHPRCTDPSIGQWLLLAPRPARSLVVTAHRTNVGFPVCVFNHSPSPATVGMQIHSSFTNAWSEWYSPVVDSVDDTNVQLSFPSIAHDGNEDCFELGMTLTVGDTGRIRG